MPFTKARNFVRLCFQSGSLAENLHSFWRPPYHLASGNTKLRAFIAERNRLRPNDALDTPKRSGLASAPR